MKLQLDEKTLNAYINKALSEEIDELLGSRIRRQSKGMITGQTGDENEECPQSLVGMVSKLENCLVGLEEFTGIAGGHQNLAGGIEQRGSLGGFKMKKSLVAAIEALTKISERLKRVEQAAGMNQLMEGTDEIIDPLLSTGWGSNYFTGEMGAGMLGGTGKAAQAAGGATAAKTGLMGKIGNGFKAVGKGLGTAGKWAVTPLKAGATGVGGALTSPLAIAAAAFAVAQVATMAATKGRQRKIVRTYNCAAILAKRIGLVAQNIAKQQGEGEGAEEPMNEINVKRGKRSFDSIEQGMNQLSAIMKQIYAKLNGEGGSQTGESQTEMPQSLNTKQEIQQFQNWANEHGYKDQDGQPLNPDGIWGRRTAYVYDQIANANAGTGTQTRRVAMSEEKKVNESRAVERALQNLEHSVGTTGTGGAAYADVSSLSGGRNATRLQNAQNIKEIIRTYPPVLNQYQRILQQAGADVSGLQLLMVDQRPHRNYSVKELEAINRRIQELLNIAQTVDNVGPVDDKKPIKLPSKPVVKPKPRQNNPAQEEPAQPARQEMPKLEPVALPSSVPTGATLPQDQQPRITDKPQVQATLPQNAVRTMAKTAAESPSVVSQREKNHALRNMKNNALNAIDSDAYAGDRKSKRSDKQFVRNGYRTIKRGDQHPSLEESKTRKKLSESEFKNLVKQTLLESLKK